MEQVLALVRRGRLVMRSLEHSPKPGESPSAEAECILYFTLMSAIDAGLIGGCTQGVASREPAAWADGIGVVGAAGEGAQE